MSLRVVGAGVGRTGTSSLQVALERLLGGRCYHMDEVLRHADHTQLWTRAVRNQPPDWDVLFGGYVATVDWPSAAFWRPLSAAFPDALVLLSRRADPEKWFDSVSKTIDVVLTHEPPKQNRAWHAMAREVVATTFTPIPMERVAAIAAYERHNAGVRAATPSDRLLEWEVGDGWEPICARLGVPVPDEEFPHLNTAERFSQSILPRMGPPLRESRLRRFLKR